MLISHKKTDPAEASSVEAEEKFQMIAQAVDFLQPNISDKKYRLRIALAERFHELQATQNILTILLIIQQCINESSLYLLIPLHVLNLLIKQGAEGGKGVLPHGEAGGHRMTAETENPLPAKLQSTMQIKPRNRAP